MRNSVKGYSLIELAFSLLISSVIYIGFLTYFVNLTKNNYEDDTNNKIKTIEQAINQYLAKNGTIPCPASRTDNMLSSSLGVSTNCTSGSAGGTTDVTNNSTSIRIGAVPVTTLGLDRNFIFDGWKNKFTYVVVKNLATTASSFSSYSAVGSGPIVISDKNNNTTNISSDIAYILVSHGILGIGAYTAGGTLGKACGTALESENCNNDYKFLQSEYNTPPNTTGYFDDILTFKARSRLIKSSGLAISLP